MTEKYEYCITIRLQNSRFFLTISFDCSRVLEYAKIRTVLQSTLLSQGLLSMIVVIGQIS